MDILVHSSAHSSICEPVRLLDKPRAVIMMTMLLLFFVVKAAGNPLGRKTSRRRCGVVCTWSGLSLSWRCAGLGQKPDVPWAKSLTCHTILLQLLRYNFCSAIRMTTTPISRSMGNDLKPPTITLRR